MIREIKQVAVVTFSPTRTSYKVAMAIAKGTLLPIVEYDATLVAFDNVNFTADTLVVFSMPVYGGNIPPLAKERLYGVCGESTPAILISVYGNRDFEKSLVSMNEFVCQRGFITVAAGAFVGEHSYSTERYQVAVGRPNADDMAEAEKFGADVIAKLSSVGVELVDVEGLTTPSSGFYNKWRFARFVRKYQQTQQTNNKKIAVTTDNLLCKHCGACVEVCPTKAIKLGEEHLTDVGRCIKCCACVKICRMHARTLDTPFAPALAKYFKKPKANILCLK